MRELLKAALRAVAAVVILPRLCWFRLATAVLHAQPKPKREGPAHPFADEREMWGNSPKPKPSEPL